MSSVMLFSPYTFLPFAEVYCYRVIFFLAPFFSSHAHFRSHSLFVPQDVFQYSMASLALLLLLLKPLLLLLCASSDLTTNRFLFRALFLPRSQCVNENKTRHWHPDRRNVLFVGRCSFQSTALYFLKQFLWFVLCALHSVPNSHCFVISVDCTRRKKIDIIFRLHRFNFPNETKW